jgi:hypothetical protein
MALDLDYFLKINNTFGTTNQKDTQLYNIKNHVNDRFADTIDFYTVNINGVNQDLLIIRTTDPYKKKIKTRPDEDVSVGDLIAWEDNNWLVTDKDFGNQVYTTATMQQCNYIIKFQSPDGTILSYPCITSGKSFNNDENKVITLPSNQKSVLCCFTDDTKMLKTGRRLFIDRLNETPFKIIGSVDNTTYNYGDKGLIYFVTEQDELQQSDGTLPKDRPDLGICNYFVPTTPTPPTPSPTGYTLAITPSGEFSIGTSRILTPVLKDSLGNVVTTWTANWTINYNGMTQSCFDDEYIGNQCKLTILDTGDVWDYLGNVLELTCTVSGDTTTATFSGIIYG